MVKNVTVTVIGEQTCSREEERPEPVELVTRGRLHEKDGYFFLKYDEYFEESDKPTANLLKFNADGLDLTKKGLIDAAMSFRKDQTRKAVYTTPAGTMHISILTERYKLSIEEEGVSVMVAYVMDFGNDYQTFNVLRLTAR